MEGFVFSPYNIGGYSGYGQFHHGNPKFRHQNWNKKGTLYAAPESVDYFDIYKRAQLKAILSQVNPNLTPRLQKANTKEFGVQVNPKVDAVVQCSLGPKTLFYREDKWGSPKSPLASPLFKNKVPGTPVNSVRFSRPVAIYSPVFDRRFFSMPTDADESCTDEEDEQIGSGDDTEADLKAQNDEGDTKLEDARQDNHGSVLRAPKRFSFQFLEQKYGFFHCHKCNIRWESAYVWCISGTSKVYFKQHCRKCQVGFNPYRVETIQCQVCSQTRCCCERKQRHIDMQRPHRQDLCGRCKGKRLSCDTTYSFKYIV